MSKTGWLKREFEHARKEIDKWPAWMKNAQIVDHVKANRPNSAVSAEKVERDKTKR